jgi:hypothetical protein
MTEFPYNSINYSGNEHGSCLNTAASRMECMLKSFQAKIHVNIELKTNVSEMSSVSIIRVDVVNGHMSLIFILVCQVDVPSYWCTMQ